MLDRLGLPRPQIATKLYGAIALSLAVVYLLAAAIIQFAGRTEEAVGWVREEALQSFVYQQLRPLLFRDEMSRYIRIFAWESAHPSKIFLKFMSTNTLSYLTAAVDIVRRFLPPGTQKQVALCGAIWLMGQCSVFVRNRELFAQEPFSITTDEPFVDELSGLITRLAIRGLLHASAAA